SEADSGKDKWRHTVKERKSHRPTLFGRRARSFWSAFLMTLMICGTVPAQSGKSSVRGTVLDPNGQVVAGAQVTLASSETNSARTQTTNDKGVFGFDLIAPGAYRIEVEVTGFKKSVLTEVSALVDKTTSVDIHLEVGNVSEAVSVSAGSADVLLNKQD